MADAERSRAACAADCSTLAFRRRPKLLLRQLSFVLPRGFLSRVVRVWPAHLLQLMRTNNIGASQKDFLGDREFAFLPSPN